MAYSSGFSNPFGFIVTPMVKRLLIANAAVFIVTLLFGGLVEYLAFTPVRAIPRVWTVVTYMFVHVGLFHLLFNMLALFFFGPPLEDRWGGSGFLKFYFIAGAGGALLSLFFPTQSIVGASAAVYGVMVGFAMYWPDNPIYIWGIFPVKAKYLVGFLVGLSVFYAMSGGRPGEAHLAHLGGAIAAFAYLKSAWAPSQWGAMPKRASRRGNWNLLTRLSNKVRQGSASSETPVRQATRNARNPRNTRTDSMRSLDDVDRILDKISEDGISSLTAEERRKLEDASRRFRSS